MDEERGDKLLCRDCNELVYPKTESEFIGEPGHGGFEEWQVCPICGGDDLSEWKECPQCMRVMPTGEDYCDTCIGEVKFAIKVAVREYDSELIRIAMEEMLER